MSDDKEFEIPKKFPPWADIMYLHEVKDGIFWLTEKRSDTDVKYIRADTVEQMVSRATDRERESQTVERLKNYQKGLSRGVEGEQKRIVDMLRARGHKNKSRIYFEIIDLIEGK